MSAFLTVRFCRGGMFTLGEAYTVILVNNPLQGKIIVDMCGVWLFIHCYILFLGVLEI